jgi:electron transfer flavoprotein alpha subunit
MANEKVCVVCLSQHGKIGAFAYELLTAGRALSEGAKSPLNAVVFGTKTAETAKDIIEHGADKVYAIENAALDNFNDDLYVKAVTELVEKEQLTTLLIPSTVAGRALAARLSVRLRAGLAVDALEISSNGTGFKAKRTQYSGNIISEIEIKTPVQIATIQPMAYPRAAQQSGRSGEIVNVAFEPGASGVEFTGFKPEESNEIDLGAAERIVSGGRGLGTADGFKLINDFAHAIGAAVGASRAVVDSGWIAYRHQVGLTGRTVRPKLYVACGISGQIQHLAGMSSSGTILAINTDASCPMMETASLSVVGDLNEMIPAIIAEIKKRKG